MLGICAAIIASRIGPLTKQEEYIPSSDPYTLLQNEVEQNFVQLGAFSSAANVRGPIFVNLNWGVKGLNREDTDLWTASQRGQLIWDEDFTVSPPANQQALLDLCRELSDPSNTLVEN